MRALRLLILALGMFAMFGAPAEARHRGVVVRETTRFDPLTGERITIREYERRRGHGRYRHWRNRRFGNSVVVGAPLFRPSRIGTTTWHDGRNWRYSNGGWVVIR